MSSTIEQLVNREYQYGFSTDIETETLPPGLTEDTVRFISATKQEPEWLLEWRLKAFRRWQTMTEPHWPNVTYPPIDYQAASYWSAPKSVKPLGSLDEVDPALLETYNKLGISLTEQKRLTGNPGNRPLPDRNSTCISGSGIRCCRKYAHESDSSGVSLAGSRCARAVAARRHPRLPRDASTRSASR